MSAVRSYVDGKPVWLPQGPGNGLVHSSRLYGAEGAVAIAEMIPTLTNTPMTEARREQVRAANRAFQERKHSETCGYWMRVAGEKCARGKGHVIKGKGGGHKSGTAMAAARERRER